MYPDLISARPSQTSTRGHWPFRSFAIINYLHWFLFQNPTAGSRSTDGPAGRIPQLAPQFTHHVQTSSPASTHRVSIIRSDACIDIITLITLPSSFVVLRQDEGKMINANCCVAMIVSWIVFLVISQNLWQLKHLSRYTWNSRCRFIHTDCSRAWCFMLVRIVIYNL